MATATALMTLDEYASLPDDGTWTELVRGRIVELTRPGFEHGKICMEIGYLITEVARRNRAGLVIANDAGVSTQRDPDSVRGPDLAYYRADQVAKIGREKRYPAVPPDFVIEVRSPHDRWAEILEKVTEYLAVGVGIVVVLDPDPRSATLFAGDQAPRTLGPEDDLTFPGLLADFSVRVGAIFD